MKRILLLLTFVLAGITTTNAQVKLGFGLGYAFPMGDVSDIADGGITGYAEVGYGVTESIDISLVYQGDFLIGADVEGTSASLENVNITSFLLNGRYFFKEKGFRPYGGLGLGLANVSQDGISASVDLGDGNEFDLSGGGVDESNFAIRPTLGFQYGVLNVNATYLNAGKIGDSSVSDFSFNIGLLFTIGG